MNRGAADEAPDVADDLEPLLTGLTYLLRQAVLPPGMSRAQGRVMGTLRDSGPQRITVLANLERVTQPTMSGLVAGLERRGCVERCADGADRRVVLVRLTEAGRKVLGEIHETRSQVLRDWLALLGEEDRAALARALPALRQLIAVARYGHSGSDRLGRQRPAGTRHETKG
jgi:DNA-binding MarR family transcriptional regulator